MWYASDADPWGHSVQRLLEDFPDKEVLDEFDSLTEAAAGLDKYYIPTRYPNGLPDLTPQKVYSAQDSRAAIERAECLIAVAVTLVRADEC